LYGHWIAHHGGAQHLDALNIANEMYQLAQKTADEVPLIVANQQLATTSLITAKFVKAAQHFEAAIQLHRPTEHAVIARQFGQEQGIGARIIYSANLWLLGYPERSIQERLTAVQLANRLNHTTTSVFVLLWSFISVWLARNDQESRNIARAINAFAEEHELDFWCKLGQLFAGMVTAKAGDSLGFQQMDEGLNAMGEAKLQLFKPFWCTEQAQLLLAQGQTDKALEMINVVKSLIENTGERWVEAEAHRVDGDIHWALQGKPNTDTEFCYQKALAVAREQKAKSWELRAAISQARMWCEQERYRDAQGLLAPVYQEFTEGFESADLRDAKALLDTLTKYNNSDGFNTK
jgi:predicted ATPase